MKKTTLKVKIFVAIAVVAVIAVALILIPWQSGGSNAPVQSPIPSSTSSTVDVENITGFDPRKTTEVTVTPTVTATGSTAQGNKTEMNFPYTMQGENVCITAVGKYTGPNIEDGKDTPTGNAVGMVVTNLSDKTLQFAQIEIAIRGTKKKMLFKVSTLPPGESVIAMDINGTAYQDEDVYELTNYLEAWMEEEPSCMEDRIKVEYKNAKFHITNLTQQELKNVCIYYKYTQDDMYLGGITYRRTIESIAPGSTVESEVSHFDETASKIMMITAEN